MLVPGTKLGRYEIRSKLGAGGMGEVYLAQDTELDRTVAIKILPEYSAADVHRLQRFIREAKAASALNHPHILTIHEIGAAQNVHFIATEFIDGQTLRQRINAGLQLSEVLELAAQVAAALAAAHEAGIVHRDIKPENVMVRRDGYVKVLDFGLAKLAETKDLRSDPEAPTKAMVNTAAGTVMGTATYMSPEQAKGTEVDSRTDLWSLGVLLYEMISGHPPFAGETPTETISLILQKEPPPLTRYVSDLPAELERIVDKALTKDRDDRYQTAKDFLIDLRHLKRKIEVDAEIGRTVSPEYRGVTPTTTGSKPLSTVADTASPTAHTGSSAEYIVSGIKRHKLVSLAAVVLVALVIAGTSWYLHARNTEVAIDSVAVMPFENQNRQDEMDYMSDGLTDSIINSLTQLPNLKVIARSSVFRYKGKQTDPLVAAKELGVRAILTGRILQRGDSLTISTELIDARDNKQIWGEQYDRKVSDLMSVQREIAHEITSNLRLKLSSLEQGQMAKSYTENPEAYTLFMKGRFYWNKRTDDGLKKSIEYFNQALERDPNYALAYAGLADSLFTMGWYRTLPWNDAWERSRAAAKKALEIDPNLAEAHTTMAMVKANYEWDWAGAEKEFKLALDLNPKYPTAHHRYSLFLPILGRLDESVAEAKKAQELDPLSLIINENVGDMLIVARRYDEAEKQLLKTIELDPSFEVAHATLAKVYEARGMWEKSLEQNFFDDPENLTRLKRVYGESGEQGVLRHELEYLLGRAKNGDVRSFWIATSYARLGDNDKAFEWLNKAIDERGVVFTYFVADFRWDKMRSDPRYTAALKRVRLAK